MKNNKTLKTQAAIFLFVMTCLLSVSLVSIPKVNAWSYWCKWSSNSTTYDAHTLSSGWASAVSFGRNQWKNGNTVPL